TWAPAWPAGASGRPSPTSPPAATGPSSGSKPGSSSPSPSPWPGAASGGSPDDGPDLPGETKVSAGEHGGDVPYITQETCIRPRRRPGGRRAALMTAGILTV